MRQVRTGGMRDATCDICVRQYNSYIGQVVKLRTGVSLERRTYGARFNLSFLVSASVTFIICVRTNRSLRLCVTFSATNCTKYGTSWCKPGSSFRLARPAVRYSSCVSSSTDAQTFSKYSCSSFDNMCLTCGFVAVLSMPLMAASAELAFGPLGRSSRLRESFKVGFWGMVGWTPSTASQCAGDVSLSSSQKSRS